MLYEIGKKLLVSLNKETQWAESKQMLDGTVVTIVSFAGCRTYNPETYDYEPDPDGEEFYRVKEDNGEWIWQSCDFAREPELNELLALL